MQRDGVTIRQRAGRALAIAGALALGWAALIALTGGFVYGNGGWRIAARDPGRPLGAGLALCAIATALLGRREAGSLMRGIAGGGRAPARAAAAAAIAAVIVSTAWNTRAVGGSDSSCYVLQGEAFAHGRATLSSSLREPPPGATPAALAPGGFVPSPSPPHGPVPICAAGLAIAMAPAYWIHRDAVFYVVPLFAGLAIWCTFLLGRALDDDGTGACAAVLVACSPIFLYQSVQPMSDVPAAALWLAALVALAGARGSPRSIVLAGVAASGAVLMRPNMAVLVVPLLGLLPLQRGAWLRFGLAALPGAAIVVALNSVRYGSPLASGYGSTDVLFSAAHIGPNVSRYSRWLLESHSLVMVCAVGAPFILWRRGRGRLALITSLAVMLTCATYLAYTVFDDWWYLRFLLPVLPIVIVFTVMTLRVLADGIPPGPWWTLLVRGRTLLVLVCVTLAVWFLVVGAGRQVFRLQALESRFRLTGEYAARALPATAVVLAMQQSGSVRYFGRRETLAWDALPPGSLEPVIRWLRAAGRSSFIVLEDAEEPRFRARFAGEGLGALDWPPRAEIHAPIRVRVYDPLDRVRYLDGMRIETEHIR